MKVIDIHNYGRLIGSGGTEMFGRFYGIYRAEVTRIEKEDGVNVYYVRADDILEKIELPFGARFDKNFVLQFSSVNKSGVVYEPAVGDKVWVAFENGLLEKPIIVGFQGNEQKEFEFGLQVREGHRFQYKDNKFEFKSKDGNVLVEIDTTKNEVLVNIKNGKAKIIADEVWVGGEKKSAVLGEELVEVLKELLNWLETHSHPMSSPPAQAPNLAKIKNSLQKILSNIVKLV